MFRRGEIISQSGDKNISFEKLAALSYNPLKLPEGMEPVLYAFSCFAPKNHTYPFGTHVAVVEIEKDTGEVHILDYTSVDDCGKVINPMLVEGQIHGGIAQGLGQALLEEVKYDQDGQLHLQASSITRSRRLGTFRLSTVFAPRLPPHRTHWGSKESAKPARLLPRRQSPMRLEMHWPKRERSPG